MLSSVLLLLITVTFINMIEMYSTHSHISSHKHLIVLSHGLMGDRKDLTYLSSILEGQSDCIVYSAYSNERLKSFEGVLQGGINLSNEIKEFISSYSTVNNVTIDRISFVGNSLGGVYSRYAAYLLLDGNNTTIAGLRPVTFMTIATPHVGVRYHTYYEDMGIPVPDVLKKYISILLGMTGRHLFMDDDGNMGTHITDSLLYKMAVDEQYLLPLTLFSRRILYANLNHDSVVPLSTAAFIDKIECLRLRSNHYKEYGVVHRVKTVASASYCNSNSTSTDNSEAYHMQHMQENLDRLGWEKNIVHFKPFLGFIPLAHNKLSALTKFPLWFFDSLLNFQEGRFVMQEAANALLTNDVVV